MSGRAETTSVIPGRWALSVGMPDIPAPPGWVWVKLSEIARLETGHTPSREFPEYWNGGIPWIGIRDARKHHGGVIEFTQQQVTQTGIDNSAARVLPAGTVCLSRTASVGYVVVMGRAMATSQDFVNWVCSDVLDPHFLKYLLIAERDSLDRFSKGSTHSTIYFPEVKALHVCIPRVAEQRRIVAKLDELLARSRAARVALEAVPALMEQYRQAMLTAAFRGELTADWRRDAEVQAPASPHCQHDSRPPMDMPPVPSSWQYQSVEQVAEPGTVVTYGIVLPGPEIPGGVPYIRQQDIEGGRVRVDALGRTSQAIAAKHTRSSVLEGDVLLCIIRHLRVATVPPGIDGANITQGTVRIRPASFIAAQYLAAYLTSPDAQECMKRSYIGMAMPRINVKDARSVPVPIPPIVEQHEIVRRIAIALNAVERQMEAVQGVESLLTGLENRVLATAFRGELVPQDPVDEPASALLDRIRSTTQPLGTPRRARRTSARA